MALNKCQCEQCFAPWIHHRLFESCICQKFGSVRVCGYISVDEWMFWQWVRELHSARGSHPWDCDVFDTMRHSDQNTPPLQHKVRKELFLCLLLSVTSNHPCPSSRMSGLICRIRHDRTEQDQPGLCKMSPLYVTELTIDLKLHKHGCKEDTCHLLI